MAGALTALQRVAAGQESTGGVEVAATRIVPHLTGSSFTENEERQRLEEARGVLGHVDDVLTRRMSTLELQQELDVDMCLLAFLCGVENATGQAADGTTTPYTYTFRGGVTSPRAKASATWEILQSDGVADHILRRFGNARPQTIGIEWNAGGTTRLNTTWMGQAAEAVSKAALSLNALASRQVIPADLWTVAIDDSWATLGDTAAANVRALTWALTTGLTPSYHLRGRTRFDMDGWYDGRIELALSITMDLDAAAAEEVAHWRDGDLRYVKLATTRGTAGTLRSVTIDQAIRIIGSPNLLGSDGEQSTVQFDAELRANPADLDDEFLQIVVLSGLSSWANVALPNVPRSLTVTAGNDQLIVSWNAPSGGGAVTNYLVRYRPRGSSDEWTEVVIESGRTTTLTGLASVATYDVQVRAQNAGGYSNFVSGQGTTT